MKMAWWNRVEEACRWFPRSRGCDVFKTIPRWCLVDWEHCSPGREERIHYASFAWERGTSNAAKSLREFRCNLHQTQSTTVQFNHRRSCGGKSSRMQSGRREVCGKMARTTQMNSASPIPADPYDR